MRKIEPATRKMVEAFLGEVKFSQKAFAVVEDGKILGMGGIYIDNTRQILYSKSTEDFKDNKRLVIQITRKLLEVADKKLPIHAIADENKDGSEKLLKHFGFYPLKDRLWQMPSRM